VKQQIIALATPTLGVVTMQWHLSMNELNWLNNVPKMRITKWKMPVDLARNALVEDCRRINRESAVARVGAIFWIDDDVLIPRDALIALSKHYADVASGVYFTKHTEVPLIFPGRGCGVAPFLPNFVYRDMWGHGMGLCLVRIGVYDKIEAMGLIGKDANGNPEFYKTTTGQKVFDKQLQQWDEGGTEDLFFCELKAKAGFKSVVDCTADCFAWHIDKDDGAIYPRKQFEMGKSGGKLVFDTPNGPVELKED
jgi:hypothetical protein